MELISGQDRTWDGHRPVLQGTFRHWRLVLVRACVFFFARKVCFFLGLRVLDGGSEQRVESAVFAVRFPHPELQAYELWSSRNVA